MSKRCKQHSAQFKTALQNEETTDQLVSRFDIHPTMISTLKRQLLGSAAELCDKSHKSRKQVGGQFDELYNSADRPPNNNLGDKKNLIKRQEYVS
jgi:transposase